MRAGLGLAFGLVLTAQATPELTLRWAEQRLTVRLHDVPAYEVLAEFARQSGAEIRGALREPGTVSAEFDDLPVPEALHRLFGAESFALVYGDGDRLREVRLLGAPGPVDAPRPAAEPPTRVVVAPDDTVTAVSKRPVPVEGRLARALGSSTATFEKLFETGLGARDESVRALAVRAWLGVLENQPQLRAAVVTSLKAVDDTAVVAWLSGIDAEHAPELARRLAAQDRIPELRDKAASVLRRLRARADGARASASDGSF